MNALEKLSQATRMLSEVRTASDAKELMDLADAATYYARKAKLGQDAIYYAHAIKIRAEVLLGGFLRDGPKNEGERGRFTGGTSRVPPRELPPTLADLGITKKLSAEAQMLANIAKRKPEWISAVESNEKTIREIIQLEKQLKKESVVLAIKAEPAPLPAGPFRVIVIDPPWKYEARAEDVTHRARNPYPDMELGEIKALSIGKIAHRDCILWLWTTNAFIVEAFECLMSWGFERKTMLTWVKDRMGLGTWLRGQTEHCIMAIRGRPTITLTNQTTALLAPLREHSRKPDEFYSLVESLCPGSKIDIFGRQGRQGWSVWGAEESHFDE